MSKTTFTLKRKQFGFAGSTFGRIIGANNWSNLGHMVTGKTNQAFDLATHKTVNINPATNKAVGSAFGNVVKGVGKPLAIAGTLAVGTGLAAKGAISKASEQSDGSKMFSQVNKDNMATTYTLKRKLFMFNPETGEYYTNVGSNGRASIKASKENSKATGLIAQQKADRAKQRAENVAAAKNNPNAISNIAKSANAKGFNAGFNKGQNSVGVLQGMKNSWGRMGTLGKAGVIGAGVAATGLMAKGLLSGSKKKDQQQ